jgi:hypothetical protein
VKNNRDCFVRSVLKGAPLGVDLCVADGGFDVDVAECQERRTIQLVAAETLLMRSVLREGAFSFELKSLPERRGVVVLLRRFEGLHLPLYLCPS